MFVPVHVMESDAYVWRGAHCPSSHFPAPFAGHLMQFCAHAVKCKHTIVNTPNLKHTGIHPTQPKGDGQSKRTGVPIGHVSNRFVRLNLKRFATDLSVC